MNIFVLDKDPKIAASYLCNKHLVKMALESTQLLCTAINELGGNSPYKSTHKNHPCSIWTRTSFSNFIWLWNHTLEICKMYTIEYGKKHKCESYLDDLYKEACRLTFPLHTLTEFPKCMPENYKTDDVCLSYKKYYVGDKSRFAKWNNRPVPDWYALMLKEKPTNEQQINE